MTYRNNIFFVFCMTVSALSWADYDSQLFADQLRQLQMSRRVGIPPAAPAPAAPLPPNMNPGQLSDQTALEDQTQVFNAVLGACQSTLQDFAKRAASQTKRSEALIIGGTVAGLVGGALSGHVSTILVAVLSGTAGAANMAQQAFKDNGDTPQATLSNRSAMLQNAVNASSEFNSSSDFNIRQNALQKIHVACTMYDVTIPKIVSSTDTTAPPPAKSASSAS